MKENVLAMLKALLARSGHEGQLLRFLPSEVTKQLQGYPRPQTFDANALLSPLSWSLPIHYSWFSETVKKYPRDLQPLLLGALLPEQAVGIQKMLSLPLPPKESPPFLRPFLLDLLRKTLQEPTILSEHYLSHSPLNVLLSLERKQLIQLINFLGIYDLATDLRQIVDKELLRKIYGALTQQQLHFLHYCTKQPIKWLSPKLGLSTWDGSKKQLGTLLHYRGLIRLAKALAQENISFKWHLMHRLDTGRAKIIQNEFYQKQDPSLLTYFKNQVLHTAKRYFL